MGGSAPEDGSVVPGSCSGPSGPSSNLEAEPVMLSMAVGVAVVVMEGEGLVMRVLFIFVSVSSMLATLQLVTPPSDITFVGGVHTCRFVSGFRDSRDGGATLQVWSWVWSALEQGGGRGRSEDEDTFSSSGQEPEEVGGSWSLALELAVVPR